MVAQDAPLAFAAIDDLADDLIAANVASADRPFVTEGFASEAPPAAIPAVGGPDREPVTIDLWSALGAIDDDDDF